ncbi:hypothetical protein LJ655_29385 [Paraburkholderia sp. MMS20-SJTN17]|uniref:Uncharacterized protein n=1 Tax=Paraburkholderia translucens TaxID=2886945 RepID=A0ABS8KM94_9BURK|nr:hypothetical protein [Paraburkholderia sp. MMS20-SJTN17]MCC8405918.1 hypothetical protein [Paraburkholderia sp. MMS20-SJTN17]
MCLPLNSESFAEVQEGSTLFEQAAAALLHQQTEQLKQAFSVLEISESVLHTQQPGGLITANAELALTGTHTH